MVELYWKQKLTYNQNMGEAQQKILLVDDENDILEFVGYNLKKEGFDVYTATNGREAIRLALDVRPQLIILDVMMPEMDGIETCEEMRKIPELSTSIIAFLTARGEDYDTLPHNQRQKRNICRRA